MKLINLLNKDDRLMIKNIAISSALHIFLVVITALTFPFIAKKPIDLPPLISIELIQITDKTINYGRVLEVMGMLSGSGFTKVALISEPYKER